MKINAYGSRIACLLGCGLLAVTAGCIKSEPAEFRTNMVAARQMELPPEQLQEVATILEAMFGTPDKPFVLPETGLDLKKIELSAGPVWSDQAGRQRGLYRQHCAHCHGVSGDGLGPTAAMLNPYPRDYRQGKFKFKSTERAAKPTDVDLTRIIRDGIPGTAMPSFDLLPSDEVESLVEYVKYLSMRGEVETDLMSAMMDLSEGESLPHDRATLVDELLMPTVEDWNAANEQIINPPDVPKIELAESVKIGQQLFYGKADCIKCHGMSAQGDGQTTDFDDWNKDITDEDVALGALPKRTIIPRNLRQGVYRGGRRPVDLYRRIHAGIFGAPMPNVADLLTDEEKKLPPEEQQKLQGEKIWHLVNYVRSLPYESISKPPRETTLTRTRN